MVGLVQAPEAVEARSLAHRQLLAQYRELLAGKAGVAGVEHSRHWLSEPGRYADRDIARCPGTTRRHEVCGVLDWASFSCYHPLCPWCGSRSGRSLAERMREVVGLRGAWDRLYLRTYTVPNLSSLSRDALARLKRARSAMSRTKEYRAVTLGGFYTVEATYSRRRDDWHPHVHELAEGTYWPQWPVWDVAWNEDDQGWDVLRKWQGAALTWSKAAAKQGLLPGFDKDSPSTYAFVDLRKADEGAVAEVTKYVSKPFAEGGLPLERLLELMGALMPGEGRLFRRRDLFGAWHDMEKVEPDPDDEAEDDEVPRTEAEPHDCSCPWCPRPDEAKWSFVSFGVPVGHELWWVPERGGYMVVESEQARRWKVKQEAYRGLYGANDDSGWS